MTPQIWGKTDKGMQRAANEDALYVDPDLGLVLVLDGMGGHRAGEVASRLAMETISMFFKENLGNPADPTEIFEDYDHSFSYHANLLRQATYMANRVVLEKSQETDEHLGMGSTVTGLAVHEYTASMINVGDSRLYLIRDGLMEQISRDHTLAEDQVERGIMTRGEVRNSQLRHILSSVIGVIENGRIRVHMDELAVLPGDVFFLCTDGLTAVIEDEEILEYLTREPMGMETLEEMIEQVNARGGPDNTTLALAVFPAEP